MASSEPTAAETIAKFLESHGRPAALKLIMQETGLKLQTVYSAVAQSAQKHRFHKTASGEWELAS